MKKTLLSLLLALSITAGCLSVPAYAETTATDGTEDPAMTETLPDLAQDAQAPQTDYAFGSVSILNGCRTLDGQVPLAGSDRKLDMPRRPSSMSATPVPWSMPIIPTPSCPPERFPRSLRP